MFKGEKCGMYYEVRCGTCNDIMTFKNRKDFIKHKHQYGCNCQQKEIKISDASHHLRNKILENEPNNTNLRNLEPNDVEKLVGWLKEYHMNEQQTQDEPLLTIELQDEGAIPKVSLYGEEITNRAEVSFHWKTKGLELNTGGMKFFIKYGENGNLKYQGIQRGEFV